MNASPVSVVVPAYQAAATIARALHSVFRQTLQPAEVIVVDDASQDDLQRTVQREFGDRVQFHRSADNLGAAGARNIGIRAARGEWVAFLDADDEWRPDKLERQIGRAATEPDVTLITCDALLHDPRGPSTTTSAHYPQQEGLRAWVALLEFNFIPTPTVVARREALLEVGGFDQSLPVGEDLDLWIRLARRGRVVTSPDVLVDCYGSSLGLMRRTTRGERQFVLPLVRQRVEEWSAELSTEERRRILGRRLYETAYREIYDGVPDVPARDLLRSALLGHRPLTSLFWAIRCATRNLFRAA